VFVLVGFDLFGFDLFGFDSFGFGLVCMKRKFKDIKLTRPHPRTHAHT
jgi:hypothetical protein